MPADFPLPVAGQPPYLFFEAGCWSLQLCLCCPHSDSFSFMYSGAGVKLFYTCRLFPMDGPLSLRWQQCSHSALPSGWLLLWLLLRCTFPTSSLHPVCVAVSCPLCRLFNLSPPFCSLRSLSICSRSPVLLMGWTFTCCFLFPLFLCCGNEYLVLCNLSFGFKQNRYLFLS